MPQPPQKGVSFVAKPRDVPPALRLFCFPYAGGGAGVYRGFGSQLPAQVEVVPVQPPGRENRLGEKPFKKLEEMLDRLEEEILPLLDRPFAFFGYSLGATVAFELALRLEEKHGRPPRHLMVAARQAPHLPSRRAPLHQLPNDAFVAALRDLDGTPAEVLEHPELLALLMPLLRADFEVVETYAARRRPSLSCTLSAFGGLADRDVWRADLEAWRGYGREPFQLRLFPGGHFFLNEQRELLAAAVLQEILPKIG
jgi:medium-chain acyl-[acyl-carrier-protein] hydrolase